MNPDILDQMILSGIVEVSGINGDTGEFLYAFNPNLDKIDPELSAHISNHFYKTVQLLWEKGFVNADMDSQDPTVSLSDKAYDNDQVALLDNFEQAILKNIKEQLSQE